MAFRRFTETAKRHSFFSDALSSSREPVFPSLENAFARPDILRVPRARQPGKASPVKNETPERATHSGAIDGRI